MAQTKTAPAVTPLQADLLNKNAKAFAGKTCSTAMMTYQETIGNDVVVKMSYDQMLQTYPKQGIKILKKKYISKPAGYQLHVQNASVQQYTEMLAVNGKYHLGLCVLK